MLICVLAYVCVCVVYVYIRVYTIKKKMVYKLLWWRRRQQQHTFWYARRLNLRWNNDMSELARAMKKKTYSSYIRAYIFCEKYLNEVRCGGGGGERMSFVFPRASRCFAIAVHACRAQYNAHMETKDLDGDEPDIFFKLFLFFSPFFLLFESTCIEYIYIYDEYTRI